MSLGSVKLIVGLGNPGPKYRQTRHNIGYRVVEELAAGLGRKRSRLLGTAWRKVRPLKSQVIAVVSPALSGRPARSLVLAKNETFMNDSGLAVKALVDHYRVDSIRNLLIVHDDIDLPLAEYKLAVNTGSAGHRGVESIFAALGSRNFHRLRVGIQPVGYDPRIDQAEDFVLQKFNQQEANLLDELIQASLMDVLTGWLEKI